jgi:hypothetical protein
MLPRRLFWIFAGLNVLLVAGLCDTFAQSQAAQTTTDPALSFTFPIQPDSKPMRFQLDLNKAGYISGISIFAADQSQPMQTLASCGVGDETYAEFQKQTDDPLLKHADLNFDGFEDIELLYDYVPHLDKQLYCIYLWDAKAGRFRYSQDVTNIATNIEAHPDDRTITTHEDWMFGPWQDSTYRWRAGKLILVEQVSLLGSWSPSEGQKGCGFTYTCSRLIRGKMIDTLKKQICAPDEMDDLPACPATPAHHSKPPALIDPFSVPNPSER